MAIVRRLAVPMYAVFGTADDYIEVEKMRAFADAAPSSARVRIIEAMPHSAWSYEQRTEIIRETSEFLIECLSASPTAGRLKR